MKETTHYYEFGQTLNKSLAYNFKDSKTKLDVSIQKDSKSTTFLVTVENSIKCEMKITID